MAAKHTAAYLGCLISGIQHPPVGLQQNGGAQILVGIPPVGRAGRGAAGA